MISAFTDFGSKLMIYKTFTKFVANSESMLGSCVTMRFSILLESIYMGNTHTKLLLYLGEIVKVYFLFNTTFR